MVIYKTVNISNGKIYIGKDEYNNPKYLGSGYILQKAIKKYGKDNFKKEIIEFCNSRDELNEREKFWIKTLNSTDDKIGYNIAEGGTGGNTYYGKSDIEMDEIKEKISKAGKGRVFSEDHKRKLSEHAKSRKGNKPSPFKGMKYEDYMCKEKAEDIKKKMKEANNGKKLSDETKEKISKSRKGKNLGPKSEEHKLNLSISKGTAVTIDGIDYRSINHASKELKISKYLVLKKLSSTEPW